MAYVSYEEFCTIYGADVMDEPVFNRISWRASKIVDNITTGVDGYAKLKNAFPILEDDAMAVRYCVCEIINILGIIEKTENAAQTAQGYVSSDDGTVHSSLVSSVSSGSESVTYATGSNAIGNTALAQAATSTERRDALIYNVAREYLSGVTDANGVNLLYGGVYPYV